MTQPFDSNELPDEGGAHRAQPAFATCVAAIALITILLHVLGSASLRSALWGTNVYAFFPIAVIGLATAALIVVLWAALRYQRPVRPPATNDERRVRVWEWVRPLAVGSIGALVFWLARVSHTYLGDGSALISGIAQGEFFHSRQPLTMYVQQRWYQLTASWFGAGERPADLVAWDSVALGSALVGGGFVVVLVYLGRELWSLSNPENETQRSRGLNAGLIALALAAQGYMLLFCGYVENYSFYTLAMALYLTTAFLYMRDRAPLLVCGVALLIALSLHLSAAILVPSFIVLVLFALTAPAHRKAAARDLLILMALFVAVHFALRGLRDDYNLLTQLGEITGLVLSDQPSASSNYLLSLKHIGDFFNEQLLIGPLGMWLFLPALLFAAASPRRWQQSSLFLMALGASALAAAWIAGDSNLGYARNWDLLAPGALAMTVAGFGLFFLAGKNSIRMTPWLVWCVAISLYHTVPWVAVNASEAASFARLQTLPLGMGRTEVLVAEWYLERGDPTRGQEWLEKSVEANPTNLSALYLLGNLSRQSGRNADAAEYYAKAAALSPKPLFWNAWIDALVADGRPEDAAAALRRWLERDPTQPEVWLRHADHLMAMGNAEGAQQSYRQAAQGYQRQWEAGRRNLGFQLNYGRALGSLGRVEEALPILEDAAARSPDSADALYLVGYTLLLLDRGSEAIVYFERCLRVDPHHPQRARMEEVFASPGG